MSAPEFRPGDRVSIGGGPVTLVVDEAVPMIAVDTRVLAEHGHLVSRPVYPEPGQVVVALDADDPTARTPFLKTVRQRMLDYGHNAQAAESAALAAGYALAELADRAREASR